MLLVITIISIVVGIFASVRISNLKEKNDRLETNLYSNTTQYEDALGRSVVESDQLKTTVKELKQLSKMDSSKMNTYEKTIYKISQELKANGTKEKNTEGAAFISIETNFENASLAKDSVISKMKAKTVRFVDDYGTYESTYFPETDTISLKVIQRAELFLDLHRKRELNSKGNKVFFAWRWLKDWEYKASIKSIGDSTVIKSFDYVKIN